MDELVRQAQAGDRAAFAQIVAKLSPLLIRFFALQGQDPERAEESLQETFVRVYTKLQRYGARSDFRTWVLGIARNVHREAGRARRYAEVQPSDASSEGSALDHLATQERREELRAALARLPERMREVLHLRFVERLSCAEIAELIEASPQAVSPLIYRAKKALREELERGSS